MARERFLQDESVGIQGKGKKADSNRCKRERWRVKNWSNERSCPCDTGGNTKKEGNLWANWEATYEAGTASVRVALCECRRGYNGVLGRKQKNEGLDRTRSTKRIQNWGEGNLSVTGVKKRKERGRRVGASGEGESQDK